MTTVIDAHHHLWDPAVRDAAWMVGDYAPLRRRFATQDLDAALSETPVTATIVVQSVSSTVETEELLAASAHASSRVIGVVGWVDLEQGGDAVTDEVDRLRRLPGRLVGVRHQAHDEPDPGWLARPAVVDGVRAIAAEGLAFDLLIRRRETQAAMRLIEAVPETRFVVDHAGKPDLTGGEPGWPARLTQLAEQPSVWCKFSGLFTEAQAAGPGAAADAIARVVEIFTPERSIFGSDWPVSTLALSYSDVFAQTALALSGVSADDSAWVFGRAAVRAYALGDLDLDDLRLDPEPDPDPDPDPDPEASQ